MLTFGSIKASRVPQVLGLCATDSRLAGIVNEAQQRLLQKGLWWGCYQRVVVQCAASGVVTWPLGVAHVENANWASLVIPVRNQWYEFLGPEWPFGDGNEIVMQDLGAACTTTDLTGVGGRWLRLDRGDASDGARRVLLQGLDENGEVVRTDDGAGNFHVGEWVTLSAPTAVTNHQFTRLTAVQKETTHAPVKVYEWDGAAGCLLGEWAPEETEPSYRRSLITHFRGNNRQVTAIVKLDHRPVSADADWLVIQNLPALKEMCRAVLKYEHGAYEEARWLESTAVGLLRDELRHYVGDRVQISIKGIGSGVRGIFQNLP